MSTIVRVVEDDPAHLAEYARIPIGLSVTEFFDLERVTRGAYPDLHGETQPLWVKQLDSFPDVPSV